MRDLDNTKRKRDTGAEGACRGPIRRAVVDHDHVRRERAARHRAIHSLQGLGDLPFLVEDRDDHRQRRRSAHHHRRPPTSPVTRPAA